MTLEDLIAALERAEGPSRDLDIAVATWCYNNGCVSDVTYDPELWVERCGGHTGSIDAALTLVPEGWCIILYSETNTAELYQVNGVRRPSGIKARFSDGQNLPIAICIAALKARVS